jgi:hypothetical protein
MEGGGVQEESPTAGEGRRAWAWRSLDGLRRRGWLLPYATLAVVVWADLWFGPTVALVSFLVLAPMLASRLVGRTHVAVCGLAALVVGVVLGEANDGSTKQLAVNIVLIAFGTLIALISQGAYRREQSALSSAGDTIDLASSLLAGVQPEEAYALLARSARTLYGADVAAVYRYDGERMTLWRDDRDASVPPMPGRFGPRAFPTAFGEVPRRVRVKDRGAPEVTMLEARGLHSLLWLPLTDDSGTVGTVALAWRRDPRLAAQGLEASRRFAVLGARAIVGSERAHMQAEVLQHVLALLLTKPPQWSRGYTLGVRYESASELAQIGGDFYDVVEVGEDALAFIIADARGKGLEASSLVAVLKGAFRSLAGEGAGPGRILTRLDRLVIREGEAEDFVTALVGRVHDDGRFTMASAGHPLPFGTVKVELQVGAPLGMGLGFPEARGILAPGDRLLCYTDGLVEARDAEGRFLDPARIEATLAGDALEGVLDALIKLVKEHAHGNLNDDLALLALEYDPRVEDDEP